MGNLGRINKPKHLRKLPHGLVLISGFMLYTQLTVLSRLCFRCSLFEKEDSGRRRDP